MQWGRSGAMLSAGGLFFGYVVAVLTTRSLGGLVLLGAGAAAFLAWTRAAGARTAAQLGALYIGLFIGSHLLRLLIGGWLAVITVSITMAAASWWFADGRADAPVKR